MEVSVSGTVTPFSSHSESTLSPVILTILATRPEDAMIN